ncbi:hypothetical protein [Devosia chinhatensis]|uniref:hypothetical protein n=1 Tax=Devosia chinhatensis TaxID=429727 RepID=UPI000ADBE515|nr:hypothetical protein [Devosia chinhatensis]
MSPSKQESRPAPTETEPGQQRDDNLDDMGRRPDGSEQDQPGAGRPDDRNDTKRK